jgi:hypothetical protein
MPLSPAFGVAFILFAAGLARSMIAFSGIDGCLPSMISQCGYVSTSMGHLVKGCPTACASHFAAIQISHNTSLSHLILRLLHNWACKSPHLFSVIKRILHKEGVLQAFSSGEANRHFAPVTIYWLHNTTISVTL